MDKIIYVKLHDGTPILLNMENFLYMDLENHEIVFNHQENARVRISEESLKRVIKFVSSYNPSVRSAMDKNRVVTKYGI